MSRFAAYGTALAIGLVLTARTFPRWALTGSLPPGEPPKPDFAQHIIGQLYFFAQSWDFLPTKLLLDRKLDPPWGANIALTDSIPLLAMIAKILRPMLPHFDQTVSLYQALAWVLQPMAAAFALRGAGERRWLPTFAVALIAASMPTFLFRIWHAALSGQFLLLIMLGLYLRIMQGSRQALVLACALQLALLLIHPYLMIMATAILMAAPLSQFLRNEARWRPNLLAIMASSAVMIIMAQVFGYLGEAADGGFGYYSMNALAPFWPTFSSLIPGVAFAVIDGTGGQAAGYQYLGLGLLGLLPISLLGWQTWRDAVRRHAGLMLACLGLSALALTNWVFIGHIRVVHIPFRSTLLAQIRASGRLFWPVSYSLLIGSAVVILRQFPRAGSGILLAASLIQFADAHALRVIDRAGLNTVARYPFDQARLSQIMDQYRRLTVLPTFPCNRGGIAANEDVLWLAALHGMSINSIYSARQPHSQDCLPLEYRDSRPGAGEIRVILPGFRQVLTTLPDSADDCRILEPYALCTRQAKSLMGLARPVQSSVPSSTPLPIKPGTPGADALIAGWGIPAERGGVWSISRFAILGARVSLSPTAPVEIRVRAAAMPMLGMWDIASPTRPVSVWAGARHIADWQVGPSLSTFEATIPAGSACAMGGAIVVELRTGPLTSPLELGRAPDPRRFGIWLTSVVFNEGKSVSSQAHHVAIH